MSDEARDHEPILEIAMTLAPPTIDGAPDEAWNAARPVQLTKHLRLEPQDENDLSGQAQLLYDAQYLYAFFTVRDSELVQDNLTQPYHDDSVEVYIDGGRTATGADAVEWAKKVDSFGVPVILPTSKAGDGAKTGYDLPVIRAMKECTSAQIVASGGAGELAHFHEAVEAGATVLLAASVFHFQMIGIPELKEYLRGRGVKVR